jgi:hypothetical protein
MNFDPTLCSTESNVIFFPVRHHSPTAARLVRQLIGDRPPSIILIEGPANFNDRLDELFLPHQLPIALYSYVHTADNLRRGAFYPFCIYSPEWQALQTAHECNIPVQFIDLPWTERASDRTLENCYSDEPFTRSDYITTLCSKLAVEDFDAAWDTLFEIDPDLTVEQYLERCHQLCWHLRQTDPNISTSDLAREAFMADRIQAALAEYSSPILVVTGGFHSSALHQSLLHPTSYNPPPKVDTIAEGIALTPYTYDRLDNLTGYNSGMPNPGFYHTVWMHREQNEQEQNHREQQDSAIATTLLQEVVQALRRQKQIASTADLIAVQTLARGLADLRGHREVWRLDLIDGVIGGLVKEDLGLGDIHPFLAAIYAVFRGRDRGCLASGTVLPPLVQDIQQQLNDLDLFPTAKQRSVNLELLPDVAENSAKSEHRSASALLHCLRILQIHGIRRTGGTDFTTRADLTQLWETWQLQWSPDFDASAIEASIYGATVEEAAIAKLQESAHAIQRNAEQAALLLLDAALAGIDATSTLFSLTLVDLIQQEGDFLSLARSLHHLLYLYRYDEALGTQKQVHIAQLLAEAFQRGLWLFDGLGTTTSGEEELLKGLANLMEAYERSEYLLVPHREQFLQVLRRVSQDPQQLPILRGGAIGALWILGETPIETILTTLRYYAQPEKLGDFLTGLFRLARETTQRNPDLILSIDQLILAYDDDQFLEALPALRLAFGYFTPREKHSLSKALAQDSNLSSAELLSLPLGVETAVQAIALESRLFAIVQKYGIRGGVRE